MATIIDGKKISQDIKDELKEKVTALKEQGTEVTLAVVLVGEDPASCVYVRNKKKACEYVGIRSLSFELPEETKEEELLEYRHSKPPLCLNPWKPANHVITEFSILPADKVHSFRVETKKKEFLVEEVLILFNFLKIFLSSSLRLLSEVFFVLAEL